MLRASFLKGEHEFMNTTRPQRDVGIDISRIVAFLFVLCVHFFLNAEFYEQPVLGKRMYLMTLLRTVFMTCVPIFMLLTGYLMADRDIEITPRKLGSFYCRLIPIWLSYVCSTVLICVYRRVVVHDTVSVLGSIANILGFSQYSWYVNMYLCFAVLIPFLNLIWKGIGSKTGARCLLAALFVLTVLPSILNTFDLTTPGALTHPWLGETYEHLVPNWWEGLFPMTYYYIGAYLKRYVDLKQLKTWRLLTALALTVLVSSAANILRCYSRTFVWGSWQEWGSLQNTVNSVLLFLAINSIRYPRMPRLVNAALSRVASLTFAAYLCSWITDDFLYKRLCQRIPVVMSRLNALPIVVGLSVIGSLLLAFIVQLAVKGLCSARLLWQHKKGAPAGS